MCAGIKNSLDTCLIRDRGACIGGLISSKIEALEGEPIQSALLGIDVEKDDLALHCNIVLSWIDFFLLLQRLKVLCFIIAGDCAENSYQIS